jgi:anti-anti-sigma factor
MRSAAGRAGVTSNLGDAAVRVTSALGDGLRYRADSWSSMHLYKHGRIDGGAGREAAPRGSRGPERRLRRAPLALARLTAGHGYLKSVEAAGGDDRQPVAATQLVVHWERRRSALIVWLSGELDRATATALDHEFDARAVGATSLVVDLTELKFIDSSGLEILVRIHRTVIKRGDRLSFRHGQHVAQRPLGLIRAVQLASEWAPRLARLSDEDADFAVRTACAHVDHPPSGDRPAAA